MLLNVLIRQLTYQGQAETNAEAWFSISLRPWKPEGSLGRTAQDGHLDSHTAPELCTETGQALSFIPPRNGQSLAGSARLERRRGKGGNSGPVTRASLHRSPATQTKQQQPPPPKKKNQKKISAVILLSWTLKRMCSPPDGRVWMKREFV